MESLIRQLFSIKTRQNSKCQLMHKIQYFKSSLRSRLQLGFWGVSPRNFRIGLDNPEPATQATSSLFAGSKFLENGLVERFRTSVT